MKRIMTFLFLTICFGSFGQNTPLDELNKLYMSQEFDQVITKTRVYLLTDSTNLEYRALLGRALADKGDYQSSVPHLKYAAENDHRNTYIRAWANGYLGTCYYMLSDYSRSAASLKSCIDQNATKNATNYGLRRIGLFGYDNFYHDWKIVESENFRFHFQQLTDQEIQSYVKTREEAFKEINAYFKSTLPKKIDYFIWNSREDAQRILHANLGFAEPEFCIIHTHVGQTKGHEMTHVISNYLSRGIIKTGLINEGTAVYFNLTNQNKEELVLNWLKDHPGKIDIKDIWLNWKKYPEGLTYPLAGLFVKELIGQQGKEKFLVFFTDQRYEHAKMLMGDELDQVIERFEGKYNTESTPKSQENKN